MGTWSYRINEIQTEENTSYDMAQDRDVINLLFCFSQVDEKSEDWKKLTDKAEQFIWQDGEVRKERAERIERMLNSWATGKNSPLRGSNIEKPNVARFSAPAYLFNGYNAMKQYFASIGVNLEESLPNLKPETKECAGKVAEAAASTESLELPTGKEEKRALRDYISEQYKRAFYYGAEPDAKMKPVDTYLNEKGPVKVVLNRLDEASRKEIRTISDAYESIKNTKKWYGKDDESYTSMMTAVREYTEAQKQREGSAASADEKKKLETAMRACKRYVEEKDGVKFTSVGAKRLEAAKEMLDLMNGLPESRQAKVNMAKEKVLKEAAEKRAKEDDLKDRHGIKKRVATSFQDLNKEEQKENTKMSRNSQNAVKEAEKKAIQKNKGSKSL